MKQVNGIQYAWTPEGAISVFWKGKEYVHKVHALYGAVELLF